MNMLRHPIAALLIFVVLIGLVMTVYSSLQDDYGVVPDSDSLKNGSNIGTRINNLMIIEGYQNLTSIGTKLSPPEGNNADILGAIQALGIGSLSIVVGIFTFPVSIIYIIAEFYAIPPLVVTGAIGLILVYLVFLLISVYTGRDV